MEKKNIFANDLSKVEIVDDNVSHAKRLGFKVSEKDLYIYTY